MSNALKIINKDNPTTKDNLIGLDIGYNALKIFSEKRICKIPSYVKKVDDKLSFFGDMKDTDIFYKDDTGIWAIGLSAYNLKVFDSTNNGEDILVSRSRTLTKEFQILKDVGIAIALMENPAKKIIISTGLPCSYIKEDATILRQRLATHSKFAIKIGNNDWKGFSFDITPENVKIMEQPFGSLFSVQFDKDGNFLNKDLTQTLVVDGGFKTLDIAQINGNVSGASVTFDNLGMKKIHETAINKIYKDTGADISLFTFENALRDGKYIHTNRLTMKSTEIDVLKYYNDAIEPVAEEMFERVCASYDSLINIKTVIFTGGTVAACKQPLMKLFKSAGKEILMANINCPELGLEYCNARGYYLYRRFENE